MFRKFTILFIAATSILLSSCASILNSKYQKVSINTKSSDEVLINGEEPQMKNGEYLLERDLLPKQITIQSDGYKNQHMVLMQYKKSPLHILSWVPFGPLLYPPLMDAGKKAWDYESDVITYKRTPDLAQKAPDQKEISINKVGVDLGKENIKYRYFSSYKKFLKKRDEKEAGDFDEEEDLQIENTIFSHVLNEILHEKGYIDTTNMVLKNSYLDNLLINATVKDFTLHHVANGLRFQPGGMVYVDLEIDWEVLDYYLKSIYNLSTNSRSSEFAILDNDSDEKQEAMTKAIEDAMKTGLIEFMSNSKVEALSRDRSELENEKNMQTLVIPASTTHVSGLESSTKSSVTITSKDTFGSGFIISSNGYLITNYHVVSDPKNLKVILNDNSEYDAEVVRASKVYDLALLKIDAEGLVPYKISDSKDIKVASNVYAIGTPTAEDLSQTISRGIISGVRELGDSKLIQTDASVNSGNSGGPIINKDGEVIGVVSAKIKAFGVEGVAFGIPAYEIFDRLKINIE